MHPRFRNSPDVTPIFADSFFIYNQYDLSLKLFNMSVRATFQDVDLEVSEKIVVIYFMN